MRSATIEPGWVSAGRLVWTWHVQTRRGAFGGSCDSSTDALHAASRHGAPARIEAYIPQGEALVWRER